MLRISAALTLLVWAPVWCQSLAALKDLGHLLTVSDSTFDGQPAFAHTSVPRNQLGIADGRFSTGEHFGTHLDAPFHFAAGHWTLDQIPLDRMLLRAVCINVEGKVRSADDYQVSAQDLRDFEAKHGRIPEKAIVLIATGWDRRWANPASYRNARDGSMHFPGLSLEAGKILGQRRIAAIGIDTLSIDYGPSKTFEVHHTTMPLDIYNVENMAGLTALPPTGFMVMVAPVAVKGASGAPTRVFALLDRR